MLQALVEPHVIKNILCWEQFSTLQKFPSFVILSPYIPDFFLSKILSFTSRVLGIMYIQSLFNMPHTIKFERIKSFEKTKADAAKVMTLQHILKGFLKIILLLYSVDVFLFY